MLRPELFVSHLISVGIQIKKRSALECACGSEGGVC